MSKIQQLVHHLEDEFDEDTAIFVITLKPKTREGGFVNHQLTVCSNVDNQENQNFLLKKCILSLTQRGH